MCNWTKFCQAPPTAPSTSTVGPASTRPKPASWPSSPARRSTTSTTTPRVCKNGFAEISRESCSIFRAFLLQTWRTASALPPDGGSTRAWESPTRTTRSARTWPAFRSAVKALTIHVQVSANPMISSRPPTPSTKSTSPGTPSRSCSWPSPRSSLSTSGSSQSSSRRESVESPRPVNRCETIDFSLQNLRIKSRLRAFYVHLSSVPLS